MDRQRNGQAENFFGFHLVFFATFYLFCFFFCFVLLRYPCCCCWSEHLKCFTFLFVIHCCKVLPFYSEVVVIQATAVTQAALRTFHCRRYLSEPLSFLATLAGSKPQLEGPAQLVWQRVSKLRRGIQNGTTTKKTKRNQLWAKWGNKDLSRKNAKGHRQKKKYVYIYTRKPMQQICQGFATDNLC